MSICNRSITCKPILLVTRIPRRSVCMYRLRFAKRSIVRLLISMHPLRYSSKPIMLTLDTQSSGCSFRSQASCSPLTSSIVVVLCRCPHLGVSTISRFFTSPSFRKLTMFCSNLESFPGRIRCKGLTLIRLSFRKSFPPASGLHDPLHIVSLKFIAASLCAARDCKDPSPLGLRPPTRCFPPRSGIRRIGAQGGSNLRVVYLFILLDFSIFIIF